MTSKQLIELWNKGNQADRRSLIIENGLEAQQLEVMYVPLNDGGPVKSFHFLGFPTARVGVWYALDENDIKGYMHAFRLYPRGLQTWNSFFKGLSEKNKKMMPNLKNEFLIAYNGIVDEQHIDN